MGGGVYLGGLALFAVALALCGLAPSLPVLVIGRGLQGVGAAVVNVASLALAAAFPDPKMKAKAIGFRTAIASIGFGAWSCRRRRSDRDARRRSIFFINVGVGAVGIVLARVVVLNHATCGRDPRPCGAGLVHRRHGALTYASSRGRTPAGRHR